MIPTQLFLSLIICCVIIDGYLINRKITCHTIRTCETVQYMKAATLAEFKDIAKAYASVSNANYEKLITIKECSDILESSRRQKRVSAVVVDPNDLVASVGYVGETQNSFNKWIECIEKEARSGKCSSETETLKREQPDFLKLYGLPEKIFMGAQPSKECTGIPAQQLEILKALLDRKDSFHKNTKEYRDKWTNAVVHHAVNATVMQQWKSITKCANALKTRRRRDDTILAMIDSDSKFIMDSLDKVRQDLAKFETDGLSRLKNEVETFGKFSDCLIKEGCVLGKCLPTYREYQAIATSVA